MQEPMNFIIVVNGTTNSGKLITISFENAREFRDEFRASLHELKLVLKLEFASLKFVRKRGIKGGPGLMSIP